MGSVRDKIIEQIRAAKRAPAEEIVDVVKVRARDEKGGFIGDDPSTPENEAWVEKPVKVKKASAKKRNKASKQVQQDIKTPEIPRNFVISWYFYLYLPHGSILYVVWMHYTQQNIYLRAFVSVMPV